MAGYGLTVDQGIQFLNVAKGLKEYSDEKVFDAEYNKHLGGIQADPEGYKPTGKYNPKAYTQARMANIQEQLQDQAVQENVFKLQKKEMDNEYQHAVAFVRQGKAAKELGDMLGELSAYEKAYEYVRDGSDIQISPDHMSYTIVDKLTGKETTEKYNSPEELRNALATAVDHLAVKENFVQNRIQTRLDLAMSNANQNWKPWGETKDGRQIYTTLQINTSSGEPEKVIMVDGEVLPLEQAAKHGWIDNATKKEMLEMDYKKALTEKARAEAAYTKKYKGEKERTKGSLEKTAEGYMVAYNIGKTEAMDMARDDQRIPQVAKELSQFAADEMLDLSDEDDAAKYRKKREILLKEWAPSKPSTAKGLPKKDQLSGEVSIIQALKKQFPKAPDGTTKYLGKVKYIKKNGIWKKQ